MKITAGMKQWLVDNAGAKADDSDDELKRKAAECLTNGKLSPEKYAELAKEPEAGQAGVFQQTLAAIAEGQKAIVDGQKQIAQLLAGGSQQQSQTQTEQAKQPTADEIAEQARAAAEKARIGGHTQTTTEKTAPSRFEKLFAGSDGASTDEGSSLDIRVRGAHENYSTTKSAMHYPMSTSRGAPHPFAGQLVEEHNRAIDQPSELDKAVSGAWFKFLIAKQNPGLFKLNDHESDLVQYALRNCKFGGVIGGVGEEDASSIPVKNRKLRDVEIKALLDDVPSGGLEIVPIVFDEQVITTPLLHSEFYQRVNVVTITRGRRVEGASLGTVTVNSGESEGTEITLENTASFIAAFDTTIHVCGGSIEIGMDFMADSPVDIAGHVTRNYGEVLLKWLDEQVCVGDGSTEPEGVMVASGTTSVSHSNAAPTVGGYEEMLLGIGKEYLQGFDNSRIVFGGTHTSYRRSRAIPVGSSDARRIFGMTHRNYMLFDHPFGINEAMANTQLFFANLARYRMYRRLGATIDSTTEGKELKRKNQMLILFRARFGGQMETGAAATVVTDAQA